MQLQSISNTKLIPSPNTILNQLQSTSTYHSSHHQIDPSFQSDSLLNVISSNQIQSSSSNQIQSSSSSNHISPRLDALAYVSTTQLPKLDSSSQTQSKPNPPLAITTTTQPTEEETDDGRVQAYAKLEFPQHDFFIRKLTLTIGRRPPSHSNLIQDDQDEDEPIDVDLGPIRAVSRRHARIYFDWAHGRWSLLVGGRNGCVVDGRWKAKGEVLALGPRTKIQIAERIFYFILPQAASPPAPVSQPPQIEQNPSRSDTSSDRGTVDAPLASSKPLDILRSDSGSDHKIEHTHPPTDLFDLSPPPSEPVQPPLEATTSLPESSSISRSHPLQPNNKLPSYPLELPNQSPKSRTRSVAPLALPTRPASPPPLQLPIRPKLQPLSLQPKKTEPQDIEVESSLSSADDSDSEIDEFQSHNLQESMSEDGSDEEPRPPSPPRQIPIHPQYANRPVDDDLYEDDDSDSDEEVMLSSETCADEHLVPSKMPKKTSAKVPKQAWLAFGSGGGKMGGGKGGGGKGGGGKGGGGKGGGGKGGGKKAGSNHIVHDLPVSIPVNPNEPLSPQKESTVGRGGKGKSKPKAKDEHTIILKERRAIVCVAPPGADIGTETRKPPYTYASLIAQALTAQADEDGKMLVNEMCEWIAGVYPFYGIKPKGTDWQSAVRHNLNADKRFKRIERQPTDGGKGNFWTLKEEERVNFDGLELRRPKAEPIFKPNKAQPLITTNASTIEHKPSASIANLVRGGISTHRRSGIVGNHHQNNSVYHEERHSILVPSTPTPNPNNGIRPPPPTPIDVLNGIRPPPSTPKTPHHSLPTLGSFSSNRSDRLNPALLSSESNPRPIINQAEPISLPPPLPPPSSSSVPVPVSKPSTSTTSSTKFQIIIEPLPPTQSTLKSSNSSNTNESLTEMMLKDPPMISKSNQLILNPKVFGKLTETQRVSLERLGSVQAIKILQSYIIEHYKELMKKNRKKKSNGTGTGTTVVGSQNTNGDKNNRDPALFGGTGVVDNSISVNGIKNDEDGKRKMNELVEGTEVEVDRETKKRKEE